MYKHKVLMMAVCICLAVSVSNAANVIYVDANSPNDPGSGTFEDPFRRIQAGINSAANGDTVQIQPGIYTGPGNCDLDPSGKGITIRSIDPEDPNTVARTIIDPESEGGGFCCQSGEDANCIILGLTIQNAYGYFGGGIFCQGSSPTIKNCTIRNSSVMTYGGGVFCLDGSPQIIKCFISDNSAYGGGGIWCWFGKPTVKNCLIIGNIAWGDDGGGGVDCHDSNAILRGCTIAGNLAPQGMGGGLLCVGGDVEIEDSIFRANSASNGPQLGLQNDGKASVAYCDVQGGQADVYDPCERLVWGSGNIDADPCFASFDPNGNHNLWDFHLQSTAGRWNPGSSEWVIDANLSQCIDAGDPNSDWSAEPWPNGKRINMGAYGGTNQASKNGNIADLNIDGRVNFLDLAQIGNLWGANQEAIEDLDKNGTVDIGDLDIVAENWLWEK